MYHTLIHDKNQYLLASMLIFVYNKKKCFIELFNGKLQLK